ncbi:MAG TPA: hypothetical protein VK989_19050, partial [Polyangia bacterium]|nr:hypothetical protein [Polyangia bacterium]
MQHEADAQAHEARVLRRREAGRVGDAELEIVREQVDATHDAELDLEVVVEVAAVRLRRARRAEDEDADETRQRRSQDPPLSVWHGSAHYIPRLPWRPNRSS